MRSSHFVQRANHRVVIVVKPPGLLPQSDFPASWDKLVSTSISRFTLWVRVGVMASYLDVSHPERR